MMSKQLTLQETEKELERRYLNKHCSFSYPGYPTVYGKIDSIGIDTLKLPVQEVVFQMNDRRYTVSFESLQECLKRL